MAEKVRRLSIVPPVAAVKVPYSVTAYTPSDVNKETNWAVSSATDVVILERVAAILVNIEFEGPYHHQQGR